MTRTQHSANWALRRYALVVVSAIVLALVALFPGATFTGTTPHSAEAKLAVFSASGATPADIQGAVDGCINSLGPNNADGGSRRINWDGVPDGNSSPNNLPPNFFNTTVPRGALFPFPGTGVQVSFSSCPTAEFGNINPAYPGIFQTFTPPKLFTGIDSNVVETQFFDVGTSNPGVSDGMGVVFTDVDLPFSTKLKFIDADGKSLGTFDVPAGPDGGLSFLCVTGFKIRADGHGAPNIVRIISGNVAPSAVALDGGGADVVVMDDFIFGDPQPFTDDGDHDDGDD